MTATVTPPDTTVEEPSTEEFINPSPPGMGPFGKIGTTLLMVLILGTAVLLKLVPSYLPALGLWPGVLFLVLGGLFLLVTCIRNPDTGETRLDRWNRRIGHHRGTPRGWNTYLSGPVSRLGRYLLPGFLAESEMTEHRAANHRMYALVHLPSSRDVAVTIRAHPDGSSLLGDTDLLRRTIRWASALRYLSNEPNIQQVAVTIQTCPDPGTQEREKILSGIKPGASVVAETIMRQLSGMTPPGAAIVDSYATLTYGTEHAGEVRTVEEVAADLAVRLPPILDKLQRGGAGHCTLMDGQDVCEAVFGAYDPAKAEGLAKARADGHPVPLRWDSLGPPRADQRWSMYQHASGVSVTWTAVLHGATLTSLEPLIAPHRDCDVKRVTIVFRFRPVKEKVAVSRRDHTRAQFHTAKPDHTAVDELRLGASKRTAYDVIRGAGLVDISVVVTGTVTDKYTDDGILIPAVKRVRGMVAAIEQAIPQALMDGHRQDGGHAATFTAGLMCVPVIPAHHSKLSASLREDL